MDSLETCECCRKPATEMIGFVGQKEGKAHGAMKPSAMMVCGVCRDDAFERLKKLGQTERLVVMPWPQDESSIKRWMKDARGVQKC